MIKATLKHKNTRARTRTKTEEIELPDVVDTGDIIYVIAKAVRNLDYNDCIYGNTFEIALEDGRVYYCYEVVLNKYRLHEYWMDEEEGEIYKWLADFIL